MASKSKPASAVPGPVFHEPSFADGSLIPDPKGFLTPHASDSKLYTYLTKALAKNTVGFPKSRAANTAVYTLAQAYGPRGNDVTATITKAGRIVFHMLGDSGATTGGRPYQYELGLIDKLVQDCVSAADNNRPAFLFHLGDLVYDFGESAYYYDQFYAAFRNYPAPILAIPGNHDSFVASIAPASVAPQEQGVEAPLSIFMRNFCAEQPIITPEARSLHRTAMTQPGVYFTLDAPFVRIISLFSNALEDPGLISSENNYWKDVPDYQLAFLEAQLRSIKSSNYDGAVLLAMHHPPFSYSANGKTDGTAKGTHSSSAGMLADIDTICGKVGVYPHAILSGHAHNYQRYTRSFQFQGANITVPFIVSGSGGHHVNPLTRAGYAADPGFDVDVSYLDAKPVVGKTHLAFNHYNDHDYTYLRVSADAKTLSIACYIAAGKSAIQGRFDKVSVDLRKRQLVPS
jgi:hypothetical protein